MNEYVWKENLTATEWNSLLSTLNGHPLQSATWGESRKAIDGINELRWAVFHNKKPVYLVRFEVRTVLKFFKIAWVPRGPTVAQYCSDIELQKQFFKRLKTNGFLLCVTSPWKKIRPEDVNFSSIQTIWIDLSIGKENVWNNLTKQCRYDVRRAKKIGIVIEQSKSTEDIAAFYKLCEQVSHTKGFLLNGSSALLSQLINTSLSDKIECILFKAFYDGKCCGGAFVFRCGYSVHYMWAAVDRDFSKLNVGEAIQWEIIEWAMTKNCKLYDLEGIDPKANFGTYNFKKKFGGEIVSLPGEQFYILNPFFRKVAHYLQVFKISHYILPRLKFRKK